MTLGGWGYPGVSYLRRPPSFHPTSSCLESLGKLQPNVALLQLLAGRGAASEHRPNGRHCHPGGVEVAPQPALDLLKDETQL